MEKRIIAHLDMDAFFASIEEADTPAFRGKPIAVGSEPKNGTGRGVVSTANYKAREYGIHSALPISKAWQLSQEAKKQGKPEVIFLPVNFERYIEVSGNVLDIIKKYSKLVEPASIDEFYFDLSFAKTFKKAESICKKINQDIKSELKVTCSVGIGPNKLISKIAAGVKKPNGLFLVEEKDVNNFLEPLSIRELPGIGPKTEQRLNEVGIKIIKDLKKLSELELKKSFGKWGRDIYFKARGIDDSPLVEDWQVKSVGEQTTFPQDTLSALYIGDVLAKICESVFKRFQDEGFKTFKTISITVRFSNFFTQTSTKTLKAPSASLVDFKIQALKLLLPYLDKRKNPQKRLIRLIGAKLEKVDKCI